LSRLRLTFDEIRLILEAHGFELIRHDGSSHRRYRAVVNGRVHFVDLAPHRWSDDVGPVMIGMICRQSGLSKKVFRG
jgi:predicted RNA binding protein YcfA (HicA-like mRNA interferase family)